MEFATLRNFQRGDSLVWDKMKKQNGRVVLVTRNQPRYLLVDLEDHNLIDMLEMIDRFKSASRASDGGKVPTFT